MIRVMRRRREAGGVPGVQGRVDGQRSNRAWRRFGLSASPIYEGVSMDGATARDQITDSACQRERAR